jgi:hypothetical protein
MKLLARLLGFFNIWVKWPCGRPAGIIDGGFYLY